MNKISNSDEIVLVRKVIKEVLLEYRKKNNLTQTNMADRLKTAQSFYQLLENDNRDIGVAKLLAYCKTLSGDTELFTEILNKLEKEVK